MHVADCCNAGVFAQQLAKLGPRRNSQNSRNRLSRYRFPLLHDDAMDNKALSPNIQYRHGFG